MPWLDKLLHKNPIFGFLSRFVSRARVSPVLEFALERISERKRKHHDHPERKGQERDFLDRFLDVQNSHSSIPDS